MEVETLFSGLFFGLLFGLLIGLSAFRDRPDELAMKRAFKAYAVSTMNGDAEKAAARVEFDKAVGEYVKQIKDAAR